MDVGGWSDDAYPHRLVEVEIITMLGERITDGIVRCPNLLGGLVGKPAATSIIVREIPERDWQDAALLLSMIPDPVALSVECGRRAGRNLG